MRTKQAFGYGLIAVITALAIIACINPAETDVTIPDTAITAITAAAVTITGPVRDSAPVTTAATGGTGYTCGAVSWSPNDTPFKGGTVYAASVTLTANSGYTFTGLSAATVNNKIATITNNTGKAVTLSLAFTATNLDGPQDTVITAAAVTITGPAKGAAPITTAATNDTNYTIGAVSWSPNDNPFKGDTVYTASVTLTAHQDYAFAPTMTAATVNGSNAAISNNTGTALTLSYTFAKTDNRTVTGITIKTQPAKLIYTHGDTLDLTGLEVTLAYDDGPAENVAPSGFASKNITTNPVQGAALSHTDHNAQPVVVSYGSRAANTNNLTIAKANPAVTWPQGLTASTGQTLADISLASYTNNGSGMFTWTAPNTSVGSAGAQSHSMTFTPTDTANYNTLTHNVTITVNKAAITAAAVTITGPAKGAAPITTAATNDTNYTIGAVSWNPNDNPFKGDTVYTASVTLTAHQDYTFAPTMTAATVNGQNATVTNNTGNTVTLSYAFAKTDTRTVTEMTIKTQQNNLAYTHGDTLNLTGLAVTLTYDDGTTEDVPVAGFAAKNITAKPAHGNNVIRSTHNDQPVTITYGGLTALATGTLTVSKAAGNFGTPAAISTTYTPTLTLAALNAQLKSGYIWSVPSTSLSAGNNQSFAAAYTDPSGNYEAAAGTITVNVAKAAGSFTAHTAISTTYTPTLTLAALNAQLKSGYVWSAPSTSLSAGNNQSFAAVYTDPSGNYEAAAGTITVNVAKAIGAATNAPTLNTRTHNSITINTVTTNTGQSVEYGISTSNDANTAAWQATLIFNGLVPNTTYYIFARAVGNNNYGTGAASGRLTVTTLLNVPVNRFEYYWVNEHDIITTTSGGTGNAITLPRGETLTITADGNGYTSQRWYINGAEDTLQAGNTAYLFTSEEKDARSYTVALIVEKGGKYYNTNFTVTVTE